MQEDCNAENDYTNPVRCWKCGHKKPKLSTVKRILSKRAKQARELSEKTKAEIIKKIEQLPPKEPETLEFDLSKLDTSL